MRRIVTIIAGVGAAVLVVLGLLWTFQRRLIYFPEQAVGTVSAVSPDAEEVAFTTDDGLTLAAWWIPSSNTPGASTIVVFHGNAGNRADRVDLASALVEEGHNVLLVDYRGYGGNPGSPSEGGLVQDGEAAVDYLLSRSDVDPKKLVYFGESLGTGVAIAVAQELPPSALVLRSPFTSLTSVGSHHYPYLPTSLLWDRFPNIERIATLEAPVLVVAGSHDTIVPISQSRELYDAVPGAKRFVTIEGADHNDASLAHGPVLIDEITSFLDGVVESS